MADMSSHGESGTKKEVILSALPSGIVNILSQVDIKPKSEIINSLQLLIDVMHLCEYRNT